MTWGRREYEWVHILLVFTQQQESKLQVNRAVWLAAPCPLGWYKDSVSVTADCYLDVARSGMVNDVADGIIKHEWFRYFKVDFRGWTTEA